MFAAHPELVEGWRKGGHYGQVWTAQEEEPSEYLIEAIKDAEDALKKGKASPVFDNAKDAIAWLHKNK